jgi:hypothetical protein
MFADMIPRYFPVLKAEKGALSGPTYAYRSTLIETNVLETLIAIRIPGAPSSPWCGAGDLAYACQTVDRWLDSGHLPVFALV